MPTDQTSVTRIFNLLPLEGGHRDRVERFLCDEQYENGAFSKFADIKTVGDLRTVGAQSLCARGMNSEDAAWLMGQIGGAKRGRKSAR